MTPAASNKILLVLLEAIPVLLVVLLLARAVLLLVKAALLEAKAVLVDRWDHQVRDNRWVVMMTMDQEGVK